MIAPSKEWFVGRYSAAGEHMTHRITPTQLRPEGALIPLGLGGADLGNHRVALDDATAEQILDEAWTAGVRLFDTAPHYGLGLSERRLGRFLAGRPRETYRLTTKVGRRLVPTDNPPEVLDEPFLVPAQARRVWDFSAIGIRTSIEASLVRLGVDRLDAVYLHDPERWDLRAALANGLPALARLREEGLVDTIGVASMRLDALLAGARSGIVAELMVAGRLTLVDHSAADELLPECVERGVAVVAAEVFSSGLLARSPGPDSTYDYAPVPHDVLERARRMEAVCDELGVPLAAAALHYPLGQPAVRSIVAGAAGPGQVARNVRLLAMPLPDELWPALERAASAGLP